MLEEPWAKDFRRYVGQSGDEGALSVTCTQVDPKNPEAALKDQIDAWRKRGIRVAQIRWSTQSAEFIAIGSLSGTAQRIKVMSNISQKQCRWIARSCGTDTKKNYAQTCWREKAGTTAL